MRRFRRGVAWYGIAAGILLLVVAAASFQLLAARRHLIAGSRYLTAAGVAYRTFPGLRRPAVRDRLHRDLVNARQEFARAQWNLFVWSPALHFLGWVPVVGSQLAIASPLTETALYTTNAALGLMDGIAPVWSVTNSRPAKLGAAPAPLLERLASVLPRGQSQLVAAHDDADRATDELRRLPRHSDNPTLDRALDRLRHDLPRLRRTTTWLAVLPTLLGTQHPSHYLLVWQDSNELRATGGFLAAADFITLDRGSLATRFSSSELPHEIRVPEPLPEAMYTAEAYWLFRDSNWSPDFPLSARLERWFYGKDTDRWADTVVNLGDGAASALLRAAGSVYLPGYRRWVDSTNVDMLVQQYVNGPYKGPLQHAATRDTVRKQFLGAVTEALLQRLQTLPPERWFALGAALHGAIARRDILLYDRRPEVESAIKAVEADGGIMHPAGDFLYVVDDNRSYNKLNPYVHEQATYSVDILPTLWIRATLTLRYRVAPSPATMEGSGPFFGAEGTKHDYQDFLRVYVPQGAILESTSGLETWAPAPAYRLTQFAGRLVVRAGRTAIVTIRYRVPAHVFEASDFDQYGLTVQRQPATNLRSMRVTLRGLDGTTFVPSRGKPTSFYSSRLPLEAYGASLHLKMRGPIEPRMSTAARQPTDADPYVPYEYLRDPQHPL